MDTRDTGSETAQHGQTDSAQTLRVDGCKHSPSLAFERMLHFLPFSLCVRELVRMRALAEIGSITMPVLDVGCGDGLFWEAMLQEVRKGHSEVLKGLVGIDIDPSEIQLASARLSAHGALVCAHDISGRSWSTDSLSGLPVGFFNTIICNSSLEHMPLLQDAISNIKLALAPGGQLLFFLPAPNWTDTMGAKRHLARFSGRLAESYGACFDGFFQHHHLYPHFIWKLLLEGMGFSNVEVFGLGTKNSNRLFEMHLPEAFGEYFYKLVRGKYHGLGRLRLPAAQGERFRSFLEEVRTGLVIRREPFDEEVVEYFIRCRITES